MTTAKLGPPINNYATNFHQLNFSFSENPFGATLGLSEFGVLPPRFEQVPMLRSGALPTGPCYADERAEMTPRIFVRTYEELKREVTSGRYKPGQRLQARSLADALRTSTSPVTQAMRQLVGEAILEYTAEDGFIIPWVTEQRLRDLVSASVWLTSTGLDDVEQKAPKSDPEDVVPSEIDVVRGTERLFRVIVDRMQNAELSRWLDNTNDRLRTIRQLERHLVPDRVDELMALDKLWTDGSRLALRRGLTRYHKRRFDLIPQLIGLSYQDRH